MPNQTTQTDRSTQTIKQIAFPTVNGTALLDSTKYVWTVNGVSPDPETGSVYISNVDSATVLKSYRNINGTPFNGSANITTQYWGTARNIIISDYLSANAGPVTSVNGSSNVVLKLPATIKANIDGNCTGNSATATNATNANHATSAYSAANAYNLAGYPASNYIRSVNGVNANAQGNVSTIPDYSAGVCVSNNYVMPKAGYIYAWCTGYPTGGILYVNNIQVDRYIKSGNVGSQDGVLRCFAEKGSTIKVNTDGNILEIHYFPLKGA